MKQLNLSRELPEIILMDLKMPDLNGVETTKIVKKKYPEIKIIALTSYYTKPFIINMIEQGCAFAGTRAPGRGEGVEGLRGNLGGAFIAFVGRIGVKTMPSAGKSTAHKLREGRR